ncbi:MAG: ribonuclease P protein component 4 [Candidatus Freyarchaeota archaeon]
MIRISRRPSRKDIKKIAISRMKRLMELAEKVFSEDQELAQRYVELARAIGAKANVRFPKWLRRRICRHCGAYLWPGVSCRVRLRINRSPHVTVTCLKCKRQMRYYYKVRKEG